VICALPPLILHPLLPTTVISCVYLSYNWRGAMAAEEEPMQVDDLPSGEDDSSSDSESDFEVLDISEKDSQKIMALEAALQENPNQYDTHVQVSSCWWSALAQGDAAVGRWICA
jgi:hypothetical protein